MTGRVYYNKLIRDNIADKIRGKGEECEVRELSDDQEFEQELLKKVAEEAGALSRARSREDLLDELADLMEVLDALKSHTKPTDEELNAAREESAAKKGRFEKRHFLHWSSDQGYKTNKTPQGIQNKK